MLIKILSGLLVILSIYTTFLYVDNKQITLLQKNINKLEQNNNTLVESTTNAIKERNKLSKAIQLANKETEKIKRDYDIEMKKHKRKTYVNYQIIKNLRGSINDFQSTGNDCKDTSLFLRKIKGDYDEILLIK